MLALLLEGREQCPQAETHSSLQVRPPCNAVTSTSRLWGAPALQELSLSYLHLPIPFPA